MDAEVHLANGDLDAALSSLQDVVRKAPADAKLRIFLFQLLCLRGEWKRAVAQLKVSAELDAAAVPMAQTYREAIICEVYREKVFAGEKEPLVFGEPQEWIAPLIEALKLQAQGKAEEAATLRAQAFEAAPSSPGEINGTRFEWIADADMRLGPVLEAIVNGKYYWMPFTALHTISMEAPADLRDRAWMPATLGLQTGADIVALIPTRYPGSESSEDDAIRMARKTDWVDLGAETFAGMGQRLLATDQDDTPIMDLRALTVGTPPADG